MENSSVISHECSRMRRLGNRARGLSCYLLMDGVKLRVVGASAYASGNVEAAARARGGASE